MLIGSSMAITGRARRCAAQYEGQVATRSSMPNEKAGGGLTQVNARKYHYARDNITSLKLIYANWYSQEIAIGASATIEASVEYPAGTFNRVTFSGANQGTIPNGGQLVSDLITLSTPIPNGAKFYTKMFQTCATGFPYNGRNGDTANGDNIAFAVSGLTSNVMSATLPANAALNFCAGPVGIIANTSKASVILLGDSRQFGYSDVATGTSGDAGECARSIGPSLAYINAGVSGERGTNYVGQSTNRNALAQYCSHVVSNYGVNDSFGLIAAATTYAALASIRNLNPSKPFYQTTIPTETTSTDSWATLNNQTSVNGESICLTLNSLIRANTNAFTGIFDIEGVVNDLNATPARAWIPTYTADGVHELTAGNLAIQSSGIINPVVFTR